MKPDVLVLGAGYVGRAVARLARDQGSSVLATVRSEQRARALRAEGFDVAQAPALDAGIATHVGAHTQVLVCYPPDPLTDARVAPALRSARAIAYVSSTGVYGGLSGSVDHHTQPPPPDERAARILAAEASYRNVGASVLRCPGIYGPDRGLHMRVLRGEHRIPGDGSRSLSRIHAHDLAALLLACAQAPGETFVVGDLCPAPHIEVVRYICDTYHVPMPPSAPLETLHPSLRADRRVDASHALSSLAVRLRYPSYREGMAPDATGLPGGQP